MSIRAFVACKPAAFMMMFDSIKTRPDIDADDGKRMTLDDIKNEI